MRRLELLSQLLELLELAIVIQSLRAEFGDNGSGASEERQGMLVSGDNFTISNTQIREAINLSLGIPILVGIRPQVPCQFHQCYHAHKLVGD